MHSLTYLNCPQTGNRVRGLDNDSRLITPETTPPSIPTTPPTGPRTQNLRVAGTNTRRVRRALAALFGGAAGKDTVSRVWRKVKGDWEAWNGRSLAEEPIVRLILDGTVVRVRLDRKATIIACRHRRAPGRPESVAGAQEHGWRDHRGLACRTRRSGQSRPTPSSSGLEKAIAAVWDGVPVQRSAVNKHRTYSPTRPSACTMRSAYDLRRHARRNRDPP